MQIDSLYSHKKMTCAYIAIIFVVQPPFFMPDNIILQIWILLHNFQHLV